MEKKTFNDMMANLPTTETDMRRVMVEMEDGRKGWISAEGLAQVAAGLMPVATTIANGLMSATDKKYGVRYLNIAPKKAFKIFECKNSYEIVTVIIFASSGAFPFNLIINGRREETFNNFKLRVIDKTPQVKLYVKGKSYFVCNVNKNDYLQGFYFSSWGYEYVGDIDDTYTEIPIE